jgi:tRNA(Arg) A34 adenosine deaminase TadA
MVPTTVQLALPSWIGGVVNRSRSCENDDAKVALAIELSRHNVEAKTGGPFGAVVFGPDNRVVSVGVNCVLPLTCSVAHAETMALMLAQRGLGRARLNRDGEDRPIGPYTLAASSQPCCQCYGATVWAGIDRLLIGARSEDVVTLTEFDEGPLPAEWIGELEQRGMQVVRDLCRDEACQVLRAYSAGGGARY